MILLKPWTLALAVCLFVLSFGTVRADILEIDLLPSDIGMGASTTFTTFPTDAPDLFFGTSYSAVRKVNFNSAPDGPLSEGGDVNNQYASLGVLMNDIRISNSIYGGNQYGTGFATEDDVPQIYTFTVPVIAAGIVNTSPDMDKIEFYSGANGTGTLLYSFNDASTNFNIDRFVGGFSTDGTTIGSMVLSNSSGNLELDELVFAVSAVPEPSSSLLLLGICLSGFTHLRRRRNGK